MNKIVKRSIIIFAVFFVLGIITGVVTSYLSIRNLLSDDEAQEVLEELLPKAEEVNEIIWGEGLPVAKGQTGALVTVTGPQYRLVDSECGYSNTEDISKAIAEVYSKRYIENSLNAILFDGDDEDKNFMLYQRYKNNDDGALIINIVHQGYPSVGENRIDPESVEVIGAKYDELYIKVDQHLNTGEVAELELTLVKQKDGWRFDDPTY